MFDLREHKGLVRRLISEANKNDANWHWSLKALSKTKASIFWSFPLKICSTVEIRMRTSTMIGRRMSTMTIWMRHDYRISERDITW